MWMEEQRPLPPPRLRLSLQDKIQADSRGGGEEGTANMDTDTGSEVGSSSVGLTV